MFPVVSPLLRLNHRLGCFYPFGILKAMLFEFRGNLQRAKEFLERKPLQSSVRNFSLPSFQIELGNDETFRHPELVAHSCGRISSASAPGKISEK